MSTLVNYFTILVLAIGAAIGGYGMRWWEQKQIVRLEMTINQLNQQSAETLARETARVRELEQAARAANEELDEANKSSVATINAYHDKLRGAIANRVQRIVCKDPVPTSDRTGNPETDPGETDVPKGFGGFLADQARRADELAAYAATCHQFVMSRCGQVQ